MQSLPAGGQAKRTEESHSEIPHFVRNDRDIRNDNNIDYGL